MKVAVLAEPGRITWRDSAPAAPAAPGAGQAKVRVHRVGVCGTDLHAYAGRQPLFEYPRVLGHELGVEVVEIGRGVEGVRVGDRCAIEPYLHCGDCPACRVGRTNCCRQMQVLGVHCDGGLLGELVVPAEKLHRSDTLSLEQLTLVETLCIGQHAVARGGVSAGESVLVVGGGPIGMGVALAARARGAGVRVMDVAADRLGFAAAQGFETIEAGEPGEGGDEVRRLRGAGGGDLPAAVFDATGHAGSMQQSFERVEHAGRLVLVGLVRQSLSFDDPAFHRKEMTLLGSRNAVAEDFRAVIDAMETGRIDVTPWVQQRVTVDTLPDALRAWHDGDARPFKAMIDLDADSTPGKAGH